MGTIQRDAQRLSRTLIWRGALMFLLGACAVVWPKEVLIVAMIAVALIATLFGLYEIYVAVTLRRSTPRWWLVLLHGLASLAFASLTVGAPAQSIRLWLAVIAAWLLLYGGAALCAAALVDTLRPFRRALIAWGCIDVLIAIFAVLYPNATIMGLLYFGAAYAALFGGWQLALGLWLRGSVERFAPHPRRRLSVHAHA